jgi:hypothetical protein
LASRLRTSRRRLAPNAANVGDQRAARDHRIPLSNFFDRFVHCLLINYPAAEKRQWDEIVTRISNTLRGSLPRRPLAGLMYAAFIMGFGY